MLVVIPIGSGQAAYAGPSISPLSCQSLTTLKVSMQCWVGNMLQGCRPCLPLSCLPGGGGAELVAVTAWLQVQL